MSDVNKFKVGDVVKCVDAGVYNNLTIGKDYVLLDVSGGVVLIMEFENDRFISKSGTGWKFAVPCNKHGEVLDDE